MNKRKIGKARQPLPAGRPPYDLVQLFLGVESHRVALGQSLNEYTKKHTFSIFNSFDGPPLMLAKATLRRRATEARNAIRQPTVIPKGIDPVSTTRALDEELERLCREYRIGSL